MPGVVCDGDVVNSSSAPEPHAEWELPAEPHSVAAIRNGVRGFARAHGGSDALLIDLALAVTEAVTNSVVHAFIDRDPGIVRTDIQAGAGRARGRGDRQRPRDAAARGLARGSGSGCRRSRR